MSANSKSPTSSNFSPTRSNFIRNSNHTLRSSLRNFKFSSFNKNKNNNLVSPDFVLPGPTSNLQPLQVETNFLSDKHGLRRSLRERKAKQKSAKRSKSQTRDQSPQFSRQQHPQKQYPKDQIYPLQVNKIFNNPLYQTKTKPTQPKASSPLRSPKNLLAPTIIHRNDQNSQPHYSKNVSSHNPASNYEKVQSTNLNYSTTTSTTSSKFFKNIFASHKNKSSKAQQNSSAGSSKNQVNLSGIYQTNPIKVQHQIIKINDENERERLHQMNQIYHENLALGGRQGSMRHHHQPQHHQPQQQNLRNLVTHQQLPNIAPTAQTQPPPVWLQNQANLSASSFNSVPAENYDINLDPIEKIKSLNIHTGNIISGSNLPPPPLINNNLPTNKLSNSSPNEILNFYSINSTPATLEANRRAPNNSASDFKKLEENLRYGLAGSQKQQAVYRDFNLQAEKLKNQSKTLPVKNHAVYPDHSNGSHPAQSEETPNIIPPGRSPAQKISNFEMSPKSHGSYELFFRYKNDLEATFIYLNKILLRSLEENYLAISDILLEQTSKFLDHLNGVLNSQLRSIQRIKFQTNYTRRSALQNRADLHKMPLAGFKCKICQRVAAIISNLDQLAILKKLNIKNSAELLV